MYAQKINRPKNNNVDIYKDKERTQLFKINCK